jgi:hypothetical protein
MPLPPSESRKEFTPVDFADSVAKVLDLRRRGRESHPENERYQAAIDRLEAIAASLDEACSSLEGKALLRNIYTMICACEVAAEGDEIPAAREDAAKNGLPADWWLNVLMDKLRDIGGFCANIYGNDDEEDEVDDEVSPRADTALLVLIDVLGAIEERYVNFIDYELERLRNEDEDDEDDDD